jgi:hypothetical protein
MQKTPTYPTTNGSQDETCNLSGLELARYVMKKLTEWRFVLAMPPLTKINLNHTCFDKIRKVEIGSQMANDDTPTIVCKYDEE